MSKTVLGRGLATLMRGGKTRAAAKAVCSPDSPPNGQLGKRGFDSLLQATPEPSPSALSGAEADPCETLLRFELIPGWYFFGADLLLLLLATAMISFGPTPMSGGRILVAGMAVSLGAMFSLIPLLCRPLKHPRAEAAARNWMVARAGGRREQTFIFRLSSPSFVGEIQRAPGGRLTVVPVPVEGAGAVSLALAQELAAEALDAFRRMEERRAKDFRALLA